MACEAKPLELLGASEYAIVVDRTLAAVHQLGQGSQFGFRWTNARLGSWPSRLAPASIS